MALLSNDSEYRLRFYHIHTTKRLNIVYRHGDSYDSAARARLDEYLRDYRTGEVHEYDPRLFDLLRDLLISVGHLRTHGHGVARQSLHMQAMAIDIRVPGVPTSQLRDAALALHRGGVGYYAASDFVHVDVGRVRRW